MLPQRDAWEQQMDTELEAISTCLDRLRLSEAERHLARVEMERAEAFAAFVHKAVIALRRLVQGHDAPAPRRPDLGAPASS
jgi:hypothetical protein